MPEEVLEGKEEEAQEVSSALTVVNQLALMEEYLSVKMGPSLSVRDVVTVAGQAALMGRSQAPARMDQTRPGLPNHVKEEDHLARTAQDHPVLKTLGQGKESVKMAVLLLVRMELHQSVPMDLSCSCHQLVL